MATSVIDHLRRLADDDLYRRNAFRITGLHTAASPRTVRERQKRTAAATAVGGPVDAPGDLPLPTPPTPEQVRSAFEAVADPRRRLVHELLWLWGDDTAACGCDAGTHARHDAAVRSHTRALEMDRAASLEHWQAFEARWDQVARHWWGADPDGGSRGALADPGTWSHLRHRVRAMDDRRRVDEGVVEGLREETPRALAASVVAAAAGSPVPADYVWVLERWPVDRAVLDDLIRERAAPDIARLDGAVSACLRLRATDPRAACGLLRPAAVAELHRLAALATPRRFPRVAELRQRASSTLNNCANDLYDTWDTDDVEYAVAAYGDAHELAVDLDEARVVDENRQRARQRLRTLRASRPPALLDAEADAEFDDDATDDEPAPSRDLRLGPVDDTAGGEAASWLMLSAADDPGREITLSIDSPSGSFGGVMNLYDAMAYVDADVRTVCTGRAEGLALLLLAAGAPGRRAAVARAHLTFPTMPAGATEDDPADELARVRQVVEQAFVERTGQSLAQVRFDLRRGTELTAAQARTYGIVDEILDDDASGA